MCMFFSQQIPMYILYSMNVQKGTFLHTHTYVSHVHTHIHIHVHVRVECVYISY